MYSFSADTTQLGVVRPELGVMKQYFDTAKKFPKLLITQNKPIMQKAYLMVPADIWAHRLLGLEDALQSSRLSERARRALLVCDRSDMTPLVEKVLDEAFLGKYHELMDRVLYDFGDFFPYVIARTNPQLFVFEKMDRLELVEYVLRRI